MQYSAAQCKQWAPGFKRPAGGVRNCKHTKAQRSLVQHSGKQWAPGLKGPARVNYKGEHSELQSILQHSAA